MLLIDNVNHAMMDTLQRCRALSQGEAVICRRNNVINGGNKTDRKNTVMIQYLTFSDVNQGMYECFEDRLWIPFDHSSTDGLSATFNDDHIQRYMQQQRNNDTPKNLVVMRLFRKKMFVHTRETERKSRALRVL